jgi:hypothetical protein
VKNRTLSIPGSADAEPIDARAKALGFVHVEQARIFDRLAGSIEPEDKVDLALNLVVDASRRRDRS